MFNLADKSRKTVNAQQEAQKYALCSSFPYCKDQSVNNLTATRTNLMLIQGHLRKQST